LVSTRHELCQIIGQKRERHLGRHFWKLFGEEVRRSDAGAFTLPASSEATISAGRQQNLNFANRLKEEALRSVALAGTRASPPISTPGYATAHSSTNSSFPWRCVGSKKAMPTTTANAPPGRASMED